MRPDLLNPLFADVTALKGVGDKVAKLFQKVLSRGTNPVRIVDLLLRPPGASLIGVFVVQSINYRKLVL